MATSDSEKKQTQTLFLVFREFMESHYPPAVRPAMRPVHAKTLGFVEAEFCIEPGLPPGVCEGVFAGIDGKNSFPARIRFSNAATVVGPDSKLGIVGMAIKLPKIRDGKDQDFLIVNSPVFFVANMDDFVDYARLTAQTAGVVQIVEYLLNGFSRGSNPLKRLLNMVRMIRKRSATGNPLTNFYWSGTAYRLGDHVVKYLARPTPPYKTWPAGSSPNYLSQAMAQNLSSADVQFDFMVQFQADKATMPIEDPSVEWSESVAQPIKVATIRIPKQSLDVPARVAEGEKMFFAPWNALHEHEPLGQINHVRRAVYEAMHELRQNMR